MTSMAETLLAQGDRLFEQVLPLRSLQQELADNFYVERADFTTQRSLGHDFAAHLTTSYPLKMRRDLANIFSTMLRPQEKMWARMKTRNFSSLSEDSKRWLEQSSLIMRNAMYDPDSQFERSMSQADDDIATFGQAVISCEMNWSKKSLLFRTWHLRDVVWCESDDGEVGRVDRKWKCAISKLNRMFKGNVAPAVKRVLDKEPYKEIEVRHIFIPIEDYDNGVKYPKGTKYVSIFYDVDNKFIMEEVPYKHRYYIIPRWKKISGSQYAYSPAAMASLPDARLIQDMMLVTLDAGQKAVDPPMISYEDALRSDVNLFAGGITTVDAEYDERLGKPLQAVMDSRHSSMPIAMDLLRATEMAINDAWFLNKIGLPPLGGGMSPMEVSQRVSEYIRGALPLFAPLVSEYNAKVCDLSFDIMFANGFFGPKEMIPEELFGKNIDFTFETPLTETQEKLKSSQLLESVSVIQQMAAFDPSVAKIIDAPTAVRDTIDGIGAPRKWFKAQEAVDEEVAAEQAQAQVAQLMGAVQQGAETATALGEAGQALQGLQG